MHNYAYTEEALPVREFVNINLQANLEYIVQIGDYFKINKNSNAPWNRAEGFANQTVRKALGMYPNLAISVWMKREKNANIITKKKVNKK
jgi:hypothetical protein